MTNDVSYIAGNIFIQNMVLCFAFEHKITFNYMSLSFPFQLSKCMYRFINRKHTKDLNTICAAWFKRFRKYQGFF